MSSSRSVGTVGSELSREEWLLRRLRRSLDRLEDVLDREVASGAETRIARSVADELDRQRLLHEQIREAARMRSVEGSGTDRLASLDSTRILAESAELMLRQARLLSEHQADAPTESRTALPAEPDDFTRVLDRVPADATRYFFSPGPIARIDLSMDRFGRSFSDVDSDRVLTACCAMLGLVVLSCPGIWSIGGRYWPAIAFALGIAWLRWSALPLLGVAVILVAAWGAWRIVQGWFADGSVELASTTHAYPANLAPTGSSVEKQSI